MATLELIEGFDLYSDITALNANGKWTGNSLTVTDADFVSGRTTGPNSGALRWLVGSVRGRFLSRGLVNTGRALCGFAFRVTAGSSDIRALVAFAEPGGLYSIGTLALTADFRLMFLPGEFAPALATTSEGVSLNNWNYVEFDYKAGEGGTGSVRVWLNNQLVINLPSANTTTGGFATIGAFAIGRPRSGINQPSNIEFDDVYVLNALGDPSPAPYGDSRVDTFLASSTIELAGFSTTGAATAHAAVSDDSPGGDTSYIEGTASGATATFDSADVFSATPGAIHAVAVTLRGFKTDAGLRNVSPVLRSGGVNHVGAAFSPPQTVGMAQAFWETNPDGGGAWTRSAVEGAGFGVYLP